MASTIVEGLSLLFDVVSPMEEGKHDLKTLPTAPEIRGFWTRSTITMPSKGLPPSVQVGVCLSVNEII
jgi:hypothetical protein